MKHFLPSSVMLTPFLVKYYDNEPHENLDSAEQHETQLECTTTSAQDLTIEKHERELEPTE